MFISFHVILMFLLFDAFYSFDHFFEKTPALPFARLGLFIPECVAKGSRLTLGV